MEKDEKMRGTCEMIESMSKERRLRKRWMGFYGERTGPTRKI